MTVSFHALEPMTAHGRLPTDATGRCRPARDRRFSRKQSRGDCRRPPAWHEGGTPACRRTSPCVLDPNGLCCVGLRHSAHLSGSDTALGMGRFFYGPQRGRLSFSQVALFQPFRSALGSPSQFVLIFRCGMVKICHSTYGSAHWASMGLNMKTAAPSGSQPGRKPAMGTDRPTICCPSVCS